MGTVENSAPGRAALYARVSTDQQVQGGTIASQVEALQEWIGREGLVLDPQLQFIDEGYSATTLVRPALERLRDLAALGVIDRLYVYAPDRLARKDAYQVLLLEEFERAGVTVLFLHQPIGEGPDARLLRQVQGIVAEYERTQILERSRRGKLHAARHGSVTALGGAPYGYRYVPARATGGQAAYEIVREQARVVRQIFVWVGHERLSLREVCRKLQEQGLPTATGQAWWNRSSVWALLRNPAYRGQAAYGKTRRGPRRPRLRPCRGAPAQPRRGASVYPVPADEQIAIPVPPLVEPELWTAVQEQLAEKRRRHGPPPVPGRYLLTGLVVCGTCGYAYYGKPGRHSTVRGEPRSYAYYRCLSRERRPRGGPRLCHNRSVRADRLDEAVWRDVSSLLREPERIAQEYERRLTRAPQDDERAAKQTAVQKVQRGLDRLIDAYQMGLLERAQFEPRVRRVQEQLQILHDQIVALQAEQSSREDLQLIIGHVETFRKMLEGSLEQADWSTRRQVITTLVKQIEIHEENVKIVYRIDSLPFASAPEGGVLQYCWWRVPALNRLLALAHRGRPQRPGRGNGPTLPHSLEPPLLSLRGGVPGS